MSARVLSPVKAAEYATVTATGIGVLAAAGPSVVLALAGAVTTAVGMGGLLGGSWPR